METSEKFVIRSYVANLFKSQISYLENQIEGIVYDGNIEFLHHTRVMSRRIRNTLTVFSPFIGKKTSKRWFNSFKKLTKSLTKERDLDVQIAFLEKEISGITDQKLITGLQRLLLRKQQLREKKQADVKKSILNFENEKTLIEIQLFIDNNPFDSENFVPPNELKRLGRSENEKLTKICFSYVPYITSPDNTEALHSLRIAMKNLRYTTELFNPIYPQLDPFIANMKKFQDDLGEIHDYDVWLADLDRFLHEEKQRINKFYGQSGPFNFIKPGITYLMEEIKNRKIITHEKFLERWNDQFQNQFWANFRIIFENYDN